MHTRTSSGGLDCASRASTASHIKVQRAIVYAGMTAGTTRNESTHSDSDRLVPSPTLTGFVPSLTPGPAFQLHEPHNPRCINRFLTR